MDQTDYFILKYRKAGMSNGAIAIKMGLTEKEVEQRHALTVEEITMQKTSGYDALCNYWEALCKVYDHLGAMLVGIGQGLGSVMPPGEIRTLLEDNKENTVRNLMRHAIVLRPFKAPPLPNSASSKKSSKTTNNKE